MNDKTVFNEVYKDKFGRTICEVHREMYDIMYNNLRLNPHYADLTAKLDEAYQMAKKMDAKLRQYKNNYDDIDFSSTRKRAEENKKKKQSK